MALLKTKTNVISAPVLTPVERINVDGVRTDGSYDFTDANGGGVFPSGAVFPVTVVVTLSGDTQTLTDADTTEFARNYGLDGWGDWV